MTQLFLQMLTIHLGQDENDCFSAWVSAREAGLAPNDTVDQKGIWPLIYLWFDVSRTTN